MRLFVLLGGLIVLALAAALALPPFINWNQFRENFEAEATRVLGQPVTVVGETSARLLPLPSVTFSDIRVGSEQKPMLSADSFHVNVELAPLLKGDVVIVDMQLSRPVVEVRIDNEGRVNWSARQIDPAVEISGEAVAVENIAISDGVMRVRDQRFAREFVVSDIDASLSARTLVGPWRGEGQFSHLGQRFALDLSTGRWQGEEGIRLRTTIRPRKTPYDITFEGPLSLNEGIPAATGKVILAPAGDQSDDERIAFNRPNIERSLPVRVEGDIELASAGAMVSAFEMKIGDREDPYIVNGSAQAVFGEHLSFSIVAEGQQIDVERLEANLQTADPQSGRTDLKARLRTLLSIVDQVPLFDAEGDVQLTLPAVVAGDTVIRDIALGIKPESDGGGWQLSKVAAQLPGRTELRAEGVLTLGDEPSYRGDLLLASKQPSGFATWLGAAKDSAIRDMRSAGFSAKAIVDDTTIALDELEISLDGKQLRGSLHRIAPEEEPASLSAVLTGEAANFDQLSALFRLLTGGSELATTADQSIDVALDVDTLTLGGISANGVSGALDYRDGRFEVTNLRIADIAGARLRTSASIVETDGRPLGEVSGTISADDPRKFLRLLTNRFRLTGLPQRFLEDGTLTSDTELAFQVNADDGPGEQVRFKASGQTGGSAIDVFLSAPKVESGFAERNIAAKLVLENPDPATLLMQAGLPVTPIETSGRAALILRANGTPAEMLNVGGTLTMNDGFIELSGMVEGLKQAKLALRAEAEDLDSFILLSGLPVPGYGEGLSARLRGALTLDQETLALTDLDGVAGDTRFSGMLSLERRAQPRPKLSGTLAVDRLDVRTVVSLVYTDVLASSQSDFGGLRPLLSGIDGSLAIAAERLELPGALSPKLESADKVSMTVTVSDGDLAFEDVLANWAGGKLSGRLFLAQTGRSRIASGQFELANADLSSLAESVFLGDAVSGQTTLSTSFETTGSDARQMLAGLTGSGAFTIKDGAILGINGEALPLILKAADSVEDDKVQEEAEALAGRAVGNGVFSFEKTDGAFSIASGTVRANNLTLQNDMLSAIADLQLDLPKRTAVAKARLKFDPGNEQVTGAAPELVLTYDGPVDEARWNTDAALFATYLGMRVSERREREFEAQKAEILERQRLQRTAQLYALKAEARRLAREEQERIERLRREEEERRRLAEIRRKQEALERARIQAELKNAQERAQREAEAEAGRRKARQEQIDLLRRQVEESIRRDDAFSQKKLESITREPLPDG